MPFKSYRKESKTDWGMTVDESIKPNCEQLHLGAILRIADATEVMAQNYLRMQSDLDLYKRLYNETSENNARMALRIYALKGVITKMKNKAIKNK